jgi:hypothetical protein
MKKLLFLISFIFSTFFLFSQNVGINSTGVLPDSSAGLDIDYTNKGLLIPRVSLVSTTDIVTIPSPATSLLVYNTNASMTGGVVGFWYFDGTTWVRAFAPQGPTGPSGPSGAVGAVGPQGTSYFDVIQLINTPVQAIYDSTDLVVFNSQTWSVLPKANMVPKGKIIAFCKAVASVLTYCYIATQSGDFIIGGNGYSGTPMISYYLGGNSFQYSTILVSDGVSKWYIISS